MKNAWHLFILMFVQYGILTVNTVAIASGNYFGLFLTDLLISFLGFTILKKVGEATTKMEMGMYVLGGALGAQVALFIGIHLIKGFK